MELPPPPLVIHANEEPVSVKTEPAEKRNLGVPMARRGSGRKFQNSYSRGDDQEKKNRRFRR